MSEAQKKWLRAQAEKSDAGSRAREEQLAEQQRQMQLLPLAERFEQLHDGMYPLPNCLARGSLFGALKLDDEDRPVFREQLVASLSNYEIRYTGDQLTQSDLDVAMALFSEAREQPLSDRLRFTSYRMLKRLGWGTNKTSYKRLRDALFRLQRGQISIVINRNGKRPQIWVGSIINNFGGDDDRPLGEEHDHQGDKIVWDVELDPKIGVLFSDDEVTLGFWFIRRQINGRQPLAQYLHNYYSTHQDPLPFTVDKMHELSGSKDRNISNFKTQALPRALTRLVDIGFLKSWKIEGNLVHVERVPYKVLASQARKLLQECGGMTRLAA